MIRIISAKEGFRRCGIAHTKQPADYPDDRFTPAQLAALENEPMLAVQLMADDGVIAKTPALEKMKADELKALLEKLQIQYPADARKSELIALVEKNTAPPPKE